MKLEEVNLKTKEAVDYLVQSLESGQSAVNQFQSTLVPVPDALATQNEVRQRIPTEPLPEL